MFATAASASPFLSSEQLMAALPIGAALTVAARSFLGWRTAGVFAPALLALSLSHLGPSVGGAVLAAGGLAGLAAMPFIDRLALSRIARLALVVCAVCAGVQLAGFGAAEQGALPVVVLAVLIERAWETAVGDGAQAAGRLVGATLVLAAALVVVLQTAPLDALLGMGGFVAVVVGAVAVIAAGSYRGLRVGERQRFRALLRTAA
ncbi:MAG TPA: hypothetical protein DCR14_09495 [Acidimicrobiaceae bacterium]|nr:hypothetical protein [Acidimicrobiaceae bacterium]